jgi:protein-L-isoaspartate(D-aspartate) O-methyltransferase
VTALFGPTSDRGSRPALKAQLIRECAEPFDTIESADLGGLLERIGGARVVLLGEATHGTAEFYRMRARVTQELVTRRGFTIVAVEADWPDAARVDRYVRDADGRPMIGKAFARFPTWMWRNREAEEFAGWLHDHNRTLSDPALRIGFFGLDLYSLYTSIDVVLAYLDQVDPDAARRARGRYGCLAQWEGEPSWYGRELFGGNHRSCEAEVLRALEELLQRRLEYIEHDGDRFLDAVQNARLVASAERYYRELCLGSVHTWNLRDQHMFETLRSLLESRGPDARAVVWAHNSHLGDAAATEMGLRGELNVGHLCRREFGDGAYLVGFGTDRGTVVAAADWDEPMQVMAVRPAHPESYEHLCHLAAVPAFCLPLRHAPRPELPGELAGPRLERAIGVVYRPEAERESHYFHASLPLQFDEYVWFDESRAVRALGGAAAPSPEA